MTDSDRHKGFSLIELLVVITIIGVLAAIALPNYIKAKDRAKEAESKANLHTIQIALERYAVDNGIYPPYLIGGDCGGWLRWHGFYDTGVPPEVARNYQARKTYPDFVIDPLIEYSYVTSYPENPFVSDAKVIRDKTWDYTLEVGDPRFGSHGNLAGQGLDDPMFYGWVDGNWEASKLMDFALTLPDADRLGFGTWFRDVPQLHYMFGGRRGPVHPIRAWWPGNWFYRGGWATAHYMDNNIIGHGYPAHPMYRTGPYTYILGAYGSTQTEGFDVIRLESTYSNEADLYYRGPPPFNINATNMAIKVGVWVAGVNMWDVNSDSRGIPEVFGGWWHNYMGAGERGENPRPSFPYYNWTPSEGYDWAYGCPDGVKDGIVLVLTPDGGFKPDSQNWSTEF